MGTISYRGPCISEQEATGPVPLTQRETNDGIIDDIQVISPPYELLQGYLCPICKVRKEIFNSLLSDLMCGIFTITGISGVFFYFVQLPVN